VAARLAKLLGLDASFISQMKEGKRPVPATLAPLIAGELRVEASSISEEYARVEAAAGHLKPISSSDATQAQALPNQLRRVRIEGAIAMDDKGFWGTTETETGVRFVEWAAGEGAYALEVASDALHQKYKRGSVLVFDNGTLEPGEPVHLVLADSRQAILEFLYESSGRVYLQSLLGADRYSFGRDEIKSVHAYAGHVSARLIKS